MYRIRQFFRHVFAHYSPDDAAFTQSILTQEEFQLFQRLPVFEKRHAVDVAQYLAKFRTDIPAKEFQSLRKAGLLHDIGKVGLPLNPFEKSIFVLLRLFLPKLVLWMARSGKFPKSRIFLFHNEMGAELLEKIGTEKAVVQLIAEYKPGVATQSKLASALEEADEHIA